jgi:hypothetical protein
MGIKFLKELREKSFEKKEAKRREHSVSSLMKKIKKIRPDAEIRRNAAIGGKPVGDIIVMGDRVFCILTSDASGKVRISMDEKTRWLSLDKAGVSFSNPFGLNAEHMKDAEEAVSGAVAFSFSRTDYAVLGIVYCPSVKKGSVFFGTMPPERQAVAFTAADLLYEIDAAEPLPSDVTSLRFMNGLVDGEEGASING